MGATDISGIGKMFLQGTTQTAGVSSQSKDPKADFMKVFSQMGHTGTTLQSQLHDSGSGKQPDQGTGAVGSYDRYQYRENGIREKDTSIRDADDQVSSKLEQFSEDVKEVLKEELGVTEEQIEEAMELLGVTFADLMNVHDLAELVAELTGKEAGDLLCDSEFLTVMQAVGTLGREMLQKLGLTVEELTQMLETQNLPGTEEAEAAKPEQLQENVRQPDDGRVEIPEAPEAQKAAVAEEHSGEIRTDAAAVEEAPEQTVERPVTETEEDSAPDGKGTQNQGGETAPEDMTDDDGEGKALQGWQNRDHAAARGNGHNPVINGEHTAFGQQMAEVQVQNPEAAAGMTEQVNVADIIRQIAEFSRVSTANDVTTLQMQLNPEHLGKLYLELTAHEGTVSARIMAQNETVKEALEAQIVELRQSMNDAGVRVEAVEVTIASHEFERNLEQNAGKEERQAEEQAKAKQTRKIRLDDPEALSGVMSEEESLVAQMMADQGNSIDFTA